MKTIMTVDDSASIRQMVAFTLKNAGYSVIEAVDGKDALGKLKDIAGGLGAVLPAGLVVTHSPQLREMLERYTMDAERLVHQDVLGIEPGQGASQGSGDYGDNVELF